VSKLGKNPDPEDPVPPTCDRGATVTIAACCSPNLYALNHRRRTGYNTRLEDNHRTRTGYNTGSDDRNIIPPVIITVLI
jgi:hypothetical protein